MNDGRPPDDLLSALRDEPAGGRPPLAIDRARVVARMVTIAKDAPRERMRARLGGFAVAAALALVAVGAVRWARSSAGSPDADVAVLSPGQSPDDAATWRGTRQVPTEAGHAATLEAAGDVTTIASRQTVQLLAGRVRFRVPHLGTGSPFSVVSRDVHVVVRGAVFIVETSPEGTTSVHVDEGAVVVRDATGEVSLTAPQSWTNQRPPEPLAPATAPPPPREVVSAAPPRRPSAPAAMPRGTLDRETRLLRSGLAFERSGDLARATASFDRLLAHFPQSPLAPDARAALARVRAQQRAAP